MKIDLHNHSFYSDGLYSPKEVVDIAIKNNVDCFALTDHDSVFGCEEIQEYAKSKNMLVLNGMELSTDYKGESVHIVCLFKNNIVPKKFIDFSIEKKESRKKRAIEMMKKIRDIYNVKIDLDSLIAQSEIITRANMLYNIAECNNISKEEAAKYIARTSKAYIPSTKLSTEEGIKFVSDSDCITILAHPCLLPKDYVEDIVKMGVDGIEVRYPANALGDEEYFSNLADKYNLLKSAGSDFHGDVGKEHGMIGTSTLNQEEFKPILERLGIIWK